MRKLKHQLFTIAVVAALTATASAAKGKPAPCPLSEKDFLGHWTLPISYEPGEKNDLLPENDSMAIAFQIEGGKRVFNSWLHHRPDAFGRSWRFVDCKVIVSVFDADDTIYRFIDDDGKRLVEVFDTETGEVSDAFSRLPDVK